MDVIWKYPLNVGSQTIELPRGADLLHIAEQHGCLTLWARVAPTAPLVTRNVLVVGTGGAPRVTGRCSYVGTAALCTVGGDYVWHAFDLGEYIP